MDSDSESKGAGRTGSRNRSRERDSNYSVSDRRSNSYGNRGGDGGRDTSSNTSTNTRGPDSVNGANRRQSAISSFSQTISDTFKGLTEGIADIGQDLGEKLGYGHDPEPTFKGSQDLSKLNTHTQEQMKKGEDLARRDQAINTVASLSGYNSVTNAISGLLSNTLSPTAKMGYDETEEKGLSTLTKTGINTITRGLLKGIPAPGISTLTNAASYAMMSSPEENTEQTNTSPQENRRRNAINAFSGSGSGRSGSRNISSYTTNNQPNPLTWEPATYGFGNYGSHTRGLLKS